MRYLLNFLKKIIKKTKKRNERVEIKREEREEGEKRRILETTVLVDPVSKVHSAIENLFILYLIL